MATQQQISDITALYIGYFDRAPDPAGLQFWIDQIDNGRPFNTIAADFAASPEALALYPYLTNPGIVTPSMFVVQIYANLFNRAPDAAGLTFWTEVLANGDVSPADMIEAIIHGAVDAPADNTFDRSTLDNKIEVGLDFVTKTANTPGFVYDDAAAAAAVSVVNGVTHDPATVDAGKLAVDEFLNPSSESFTLTTGVDTFAGGDAASVFNAPLSVGIDGLVAVQTLQGADVLDGGAGRDTLNAELNGTGTTANPTLSGIEVVNLTSVYGLALGVGGPGVIDLNRATGIEEIWNIGSRNDLDVWGVNAPVLVGLDGVLGGTWTEIEYDFDTRVAEQTVVADRVGSQDSGPAFLEIDAIGGIETLNLEVSNGVRLDLGDTAAGIANLNISGSGLLQLEAASDFENLVNLNSTGYNEDLNLDVGGSTVLESVLTGDGNDRIEVNHQAVDGGLSVDLGGGQNILAIDSGSWWDLDHTDINGLDFTGGVSNVQTLEFDDEVNLGGDATLDLDGFDVPPATIAFAESLYGNSNDFSVANAGADLLLTAAEEIELYGGQLTVDGVVNLTVESTGAGASNVRLDGSVGGDALETLTVNAADDAEVELTTPADLAVLRDVSVNAAGDDAELTIRGNAGVRQVLGVHQVETITVNVTAGAASGFLNNRTSSGTVALSSSDINGGVLTAGYSTTTSLLPANSSLHDAGAATDIATVLDARTEFDATSDPLSNVVTVTWANFGPHQALAYFAPGSSATQGTLDSVTIAVTPGIAEVPMEAGSGYEALETVTLDAADDATAHLEDVYGSFTLTVTAGDNADVELYNTEATEVTVTAVDHANVDIGGDTIGARSLETVIVTANTAEVDLGSSGHAGVGNDFTSFRTLDVSSVTTYVSVDATEANYHQATGQVVTYAIGATQDGTAAVDVEFSANDAREVFDFVGADIGEVELTGFTAGSDPLIGDRIDLSQFDIRSAGDLIFTDSGLDLVITDLGDDFGGSITLIGLAGQGTDVAAFNIIYA